MDLSPKTKNSSHSSQQKDATLSLEKRLQLFMQEISGRALVMMENACQGQQDVAMDLVQEAFISLHQNYSDKPTEEWYPLFYTILNHKLMDWRRKEARRSQRFGWLKLNPIADEDDQEFDIADQNQIEPSTQLLNDLTYDEIYAAIQALPVRQQQAFMLRAWEGFDTATTAKIMDCSEGSVKTHYHRAIQSLKSTLAHLNSDD
ncbi:RNA polymerase sigma factor [Acinetobacter qingfengensis]|uniref:RNA polymerase sigma factor n=2 Tax=Acinetobacter qingfengensis TaxID=1262585 RepID=A0A1E7RFL7_9GAMM|nr:RNA polymerase sigma factor [Acinetobacter qingfengensis]